MKKGQAWTIEFILAFLIFSSTIILSVKIVTNIYKNDVYSDLVRDSEILSNQLLSEGYPKNWTSEDLIKIGILSDNRINESKLLALYSSNYSSTKSYLGINYEYYVFFKKNNDWIIFNGSCGYGNPIVNAYIIDNSSNNCVIDDIEASNIIRNTRLTIYNNSVVEMNTYSWKR